MLYTFPNICNSHINLKKPSARRLKLYNQFPGNYDSIQSMTTDLERIKEMGFDQVWINPFYKPCQSNFLNPNKIHCPYAMQSHLELNTEYGNGFRDIIKYTKRARELGMVPLFDFVGRHVAIDHPFVTGTSELAKKGIDTQRWFKRHKNGNFVIKGMDENYKPLTEDPWTDVVEFNYDDPEILQEIMTHFWKPFIDFNIKKLGFMGARLDAVGTISRKAHEIILPYINKVCRETYAQDAFLVAETVGLKHMKDSEVVKGLVTHTMNNVFWMPGPEGRGNDKYELWQDDQNWHEKSKFFLQTIAPTAGHSGSHDEDRYPDILKRKGVTDINVIKQRMIEMIMVSAFSSDGGHILAYGDEYGVTSRVDLFHPCVIQKEDKVYDISNAIKEINSLVDNLPNVQLPQSAHRIMLESQPELVIFIIEQGEPKNSYMVIGNTNYEKPVIINQELIQEIKAAYTHNKNELPSSTYLCGKVTLENPELLDVLIASEHLAKPYRRAKIF